MKKKSIVKDQLVSISVGGEYCDIVGKVIDVDNGYVIDLMPLCPVPLSCLVNLPFDTIVKDTGNKSVPHLVCIPSHSAAADKILDISGNKRFYSSIPFDFRSNLNDFVSSIDIRSLTEMGRTLNIKFYYLGHENKQNTLSMEFSSKYLRPFFWGEDWTEDSFSPYGWTIGYHEWPTLRIAGKTSVGFSDPEERLVPYEFYLNNMSIFLFGDNSVLSIDGNLLTAISAAKNCHPEKELVDLAIKEREAVNNCKDPVDEEFSVDGNERIIVNSVTKEIIFKCRTST